MHCCLQLTFDFEIVSFTVINLFQSLVCHAHILQCLIVNTSQHCLQESVNLFYNYHSDSIARALMAIIVVLFIKKNTIHDIIKNKLLLVWNLAQFHIIIYVNNVFTLNKRINWFDSET